MPKRWFIWSNLCRKQGLRGDWLDIRWVIEKNACQTCQLTLAGFGIASLHYGASRREIAVYQRFINDTSICVAAKKLA